MNDVKLAPADTGLEPQSELVDAAQDAVRQWRFTPTLLNDQPVDAVITVNVVFRNP
jgi:outer membrane biosynthesis protein TonB